MMNQDKPIQTQPINWQAEALFWQQKYTEQLMHSSQVIIALSRGNLHGAAPVPEVPESPSAGQSAASNGHPTPVTTEHLTEGKTQ